LAEYRDRHEQFLAAGYDLVALSVDDPQRTAPVVARLGLSFPVLGDPARAVVEAWGLLNRAEKGGIAHPAVFVLDRERRVRYFSHDEISKRVSADDVLAFVRGAAGPPTRRSRVRAGPRDFLHAILNALRRGFVTPRS